MSSPRAAGMVRIGHTYDVNAPDDVLLTHFDAQGLADTIEQEIFSIEGIARTGKVLEVIGMLVKVAGLDVMLGEL
ncbi:EscN/YscN/HrcN family type III secretion system ATPase, partial [Paraburkholderia sp. UYCP14C]